MMNKSDKKKGMTLIEIIISMMIITIMLIPILGLIVNAVRSNASGEAKQKATLAGQQIFENIKSDIMLQGLTIDSGSADIQLNGLTLTKNGADYNTVGAGDDYTYNGQQYKVKIEMKKNKSLQSSVGSNDDYDAQYEISGDNGSCTIKLIKTGSKVMGTINDSSSVSSKTINIEQSSDRKSIKVNNSILINSKGAEKIKGRVLLDFTKFKFNDAEPDKKIVVKVNNLSSTDNISVCTQKLESQDVNVEIENDALSVGTIKAYYKEVEKSYIDGVSEPWNINIKVFKAGDSTQLFNGDITQNVQTN